MSLVAYANSDNEDDISDDDEPVQSVDRGILVSTQPSPSITVGVTNQTVGLPATLNLPPPSATPVSNHNLSNNAGNDSVNLDSSTAQHLFAGLPSVTPKQTDEKEEELEDIVKPRSAELSLRQVPGKKRGPVKIVVPSLADYGDDSDDDDDTRSSKRQRPSSSRGSSLLSSLPPPEHVTSVTSLVPKSLATNAAAQKTKSTPALPPSAQLSKPKPVTGVKLPATGSAKAAVRTVDDSDDESSAADFFSLDVTTSRPQIPIASGVSVDDATDVRWSSVRPSVLSAGHSLHGAGVSATVTSSASTVDSTQELEMGSVQGPCLPTDSFESTYADPQQFEDNFNNPDFQRAFGKRVPKGDVKVLNVNLSDVLSDVDVTKNLSNDVDQMMSHSKKNRDLPSSQQKRKHQLSFLAFKAKERELELKNQWSENRFTKRQTQSKYGF